MEFVARSRGGASGGWWSEFVEKVGSIGHLQIYAVHHRSLGPFALSLNEAGIAEFPLDAGGETPFAPAGRGPHARGRTIVAGLAIRQP